jgi:hypothetical protein
MSIYVRTADPHKLISDINDKIKKSNIDTWSVDDEGDYTHTAIQWKNRAWFHPIFETDRVVFAIWGRVSENLSVVDYAIYHGRFVEMLLSHFDNECNNIEVTSLATSYDRIKAEPKKSEK